MGISGLLPMLKPACKPSHVSQFRGKTFAIDVYCFLHKGAFGCAEQLVQGKPTDGYVKYVMKYVSLLLNYDIKPILVFDGRNLPSKVSDQFNPKMLSNSLITIHLGRNREEATGSEEGEQREGGGYAAAGAGQGGQGVLPAECGHHARDGAQHHQGRQGAQC